MRGRVSGFGFQVSTDLLEGAGAALVALQRPHDLLQNHASLKEFGGSGIMVEG